MNVGDVSAQKPFFFSPHGNIPARHSSPHGPHPHDFPDRRQERGARGGARSLARCEQAAGAQPDTSRAGNRSAQPRKDGTVGTAHGFGVGAGERDLTQASSPRAAPACLRTDSSTGTRPLPSPSPSPPSGMVEAGSRPWATICEGLRGGAENSQEWTEQSAGAATTAVSRRRQVQADCATAKAGLGEPPIGHLSHRWLTS